MAILGNNTANNLVGTSGNDYINAGRGDDTISGGDGDDILRDGRGSDTITGGDGFDVFRMTDKAGDTDTDTITDFTQSEDFIDLQATSASSLSDLSISYGADATITLPNGNTVVLTGVTGGLTEADFIFSPTQTGDGGNNTFTGTGAADTLSGKSGNDTLSGREGNDTLLGNAGDDTLSGGADNDKLFGAAGDDVLNGGSGDDVLLGEDGDDVLKGGSGTDILRGGDGSDVFAFSSGDGSDTIGDFTDGEDLINIRKLGVTDASFATDVTISDLGDDTQIDVGGVTILLEDTDSSDITADDFLLQ